MTYFIIRSIGCLILTISLSCNIAYEIHASFQENAIHIIYQHFLYMRPILIGGLFFYYLIGEIKQMK